MFHKKPGSDEPNEDEYAEYIRFLLESLCRCFGHTCVLTGAEDFVFLLTLAKTEYEIDLENPDLVVYDLEVHCHITEFVRALQERLTYWIKGRCGPIPVLKKFRADCDAALKENGKFREMKC